MDSKKKQKTLLTREHSMAKIGGKNSDEQHYPGKCLSYAAAAYSASLPVQQDTMDHQFCNNENRNYQEMVCKNMDKVTTATATTIATAAAAAATTIDDDDDQTITSKRIRTSFKKFQLDLLRQYFKRTHKPNITELNLLMNQTNLSRRVLQVI